MTKKLKRSSKLDIPRDQLTDKDRKALRTQARRQEKKAEEIMEHLYKPLDEWDNEELARGRPRARDGSFSGPKPKWISLKVHEEAMRRFQDIVKGEMRAGTAGAIKLIQEIVENDDLVYDDEGQPIRHLVSQNTKLQAAMFLIEHLIGKPTQQVKGDISLQVQSILAGAVVNPDEQPAIDAGDDDDDEEDDD